MNKQLSDIWNPIKNFHINAYRFGQEGVAEENQEKLSGRINGILSTTIFFPICLPIGAALCSLAFKENYFSREYKGLFETPREINKISSGKKQR